jgi:hypothetical protein
VITHRVATEILVERIVVIWNAAFYSTQVLRSNLCGCNDYTLIYDPQKVGPPRPCIQLSQVINALKLYRIGLVEPT